MGSGLVHLLTQKKSCGPNTMSSAPIITRNMDHKMNAKQKQVLELGYPVIDTENNIYSIGGESLPHKAPTTEELYGFFDEAGVWDDNITIYNVPSHAIQFALGIVEELEVKPWKDPR